MLTESELDFRVDTLLRADDFGRAHWTSHEAPRITLSYKFETSAAGDIPWNNVGGFTAYSAAEQDAVRTALAEFSHFMNVDFVEAPSSSDPTLSFYKADDLYTDDAGFNGNGGRGRWSYSGNEWDGAAVFNSHLDLSQNYLYDLVLHEIGHTLGLKHPADVDVGGNNPPGPFLPTDEDSDRFTVMSYNTNPVTGQESRHLMLYDIAALQQWWGSNSSANTGDSNYSGPDDGRVQVIWDAAGTDSFSYSGNSNAIIDIREGAFSSLGAVDNLAVAYGTIIENATGGNGNDTITGNTTGNRLTGNLGMDTINAGAGNDTVVATHADGNDTYTGGTGFDILDFSAVQGVVQINQLGGVITGSSGTDTLNDVFEQIIGSNFDDALSGGNGGDVLDGSDGNDRFFGNGGDDLMRGGEGNDTFFFSTNDGNDRLEGGNGFDVLDYSNLQGTVQVNQLAGTTTGTANNDTLLDVFERVVGTNFDDVLSGGHGINSLSGGDGDDQIFANNGDDYTSGGDGNDRITMGAGNDTHDFRNGEDIDTIMDFTAGAGSVDTITLTFHSAATSFAQMQMAGMFSQRYADTHINLGGGDVIILISTVMGDLHEDDFVF